MVILPAPVQGVLKFWEQPVDDFSIPLPSSWLEGRRNYPAGLTDFHGKHRWELTPHLKDIYDWISPDDPAHSGTVMKGTQSMVTTLAESMAAWWIAHFFGNILFVTSTLSMAGARSSSNIDVLFDNCPPLLSHLGPHSNRTGRKSKDARYKELTGNRVVFSTAYGSPGELESIPYTLIVMSELDRLPLSKKHAQEEKDIDPEDSLFGRTHTKKIWKIFRESSPSAAKDNSRIFRAYNAGDGRQFFCPCPFCNHEQKLKLKSTKPGAKKGGIIYHTEPAGEGKLAVIPETVKYECEKCGRLFGEEWKRKMLASGRWIPQRPALSREHKSWHINALMSTPGAYPWLRACREFVATDEGRNIALYKGYKIRVFGVPFENRKKKTKWEEIFEKELEPFPLRTLPDAACAVTIGADIQQNRIEYQAVAWGPRMERWIIDSGIFPGNTGTWDSPSFNALKIYGTTEIKRADGRGLLPSCVAVDARFSRNLKDNTQNRTVFDFCFQANESTNSTNRFLPVMGFQTLTSGGILKESRVRDHVVTNRFDVATGDLKTEFFDNTLDFSSDSGGRIHLPAALPADFYHQLLGSEVYQQTGGDAWSWTKVWDNHQLDCYIYARAAAEYLNFPVFRELDWADRARRIFGDLTDSE